MKKYLAIILGVLFVLSFAASAFAIHAEIPSETQAVITKGATQITLGGELRVRGWYEKNIDLGTGLPTETNSEAWYDERVRLSLDAAVSPNVEGFVQLESNKGDNDVYVWGTNDFNAKPTDLNILQAWIMYKGSGLFGFPAGLKIGHMPLALGEKLFFDNTKFGDDAIVFFMNPVKEMEFDLLTIKFDEEKKGINQDDLDGYVGIITYKLDDKNTIGINYTYLLRSGIKEDGSDRFSEQDLGLHANGNVSGLGYKADVEIQFGKESETVKARGWALMAGLNYMFDPLNLRASFAYGSGDKDDTADKNEKFQTHLGADQHYTLVYEYRVASAAGATATGISNTTYYNLGIDVTPVKDLKASLDGYILRATKPNPAIAGSDSKTAGWEADAMIAYNVAKNLTYQVDAGYFKSGELYGPDKKGATVLRHALTLSF